MVPRNKLVTNAAETTEAVAFWKLLGGVGKGGSPPKKNPAEMEMGTQQSSLQTKVVVEASKIFLGSRLPKARREMAGLTSLLFYLLVLANDCMSPLRIPGSPLTAQWWQPATVPLGTEEACSESPGTANSQPGTQTKGQK